jgi:DNA-binding transcriptional ArsR family regulator
MAMQMPLDDLSLTFAALADPTRRAILARLVSGEATVTELAEPFEISGPAVCKHLKVLEKAGLIAQGRQAQWRPRRIEAVRLAAVDAWLNTYRPLWDARFDRMADHLDNLLKEKPDV